MRRQGFTLIELAVVLVVIGLIIGGIVMGTDIVKQTRVKSVITEYQQFQTAHRTFKVKYGEIAGDFTEGYKYFRDMTPGCTVNAQANCTVDTGCNGNGDDHIDWNIGGRCEINKFWMHLSAAGLLDEKYSGTFAGGTATTFVPGVNVPKARIGEGKFWRLTFAAPSNMGYNAGLGYTDQATLLALGDDAINVENARALDKKYDDAMPGKGKFVVETVCATTTDITTAAYNLTNPRTLCSQMFFKLDEEERFQVRW
jgi:prepilin-type N-terminal cleavage/methylation domain-containing protein